MLRNTLSDLRVAELTNAMTSNDPNSARQLRHHFGPFRTPFPAPPPTTISACCLLDAVVKSDIMTDSPLQAHAAICHLIRDGFVSGPGGTFKLLSTVQ